MSTSSKPSGANSAERSPHVACVVLNWNGWRDTQVCLDALKQCEYEPLTVIVVDNGSTDGSVKHLQDSHPWVRLLQTGANLGFSGGCNVGIRTALNISADYIWLLNNDTVPASSALAELVFTAELDKTAGAIGSVMSYLQNPNEIQAWGGGRVNIFTGRTIHAHSPQSDEWFDYLTAASVLLRRAAVEEIGLFDEEFFLYWEDTDYSYRLRTAGWKLRVSRSASILHKEHGSTDRDISVLQRHTIESGFRFLRKHSPVPRLSITIFFLRKIIRALSNKDRAHIHEVLSAFRRSKRARQNINSIQNQRFPSDQENTLTR